MSDQNVDVYYRGETAEGVSVAAIEYGSYYWCVVLNGTDPNQPNQPGDSVHLHADDFKVDPTGSLIFRSAGRRPAGAEPKSQQGKDNGKDSGKDSQKEEDNQGGKESDMIYMAFAPGSWRVVYAAKLQDGSPASVEHWNAATGSRGLAAVVPPNSGAAGYPARE